MRPSDWLETWRNTSAFRILKYTVKISDIQPIQESVNGITPTVQSQFINNPSLWIYTDANQLFGLRSIRPTEVNGNLYNVNENMQVPLPTSQQMGMLKRCQVDLGNNFTQHNRHSQSSNQHPHNRSKRNARNQPNKTRTIILIQIKIRQRKMQMVPTRLIQYYRT